MKLDYTIYGADRAAYLSTQDLSTLSPTQLDKLASYILYKQLPQQSSNHSDNKTLPLDTAINYTAAQASLMRSYRNPHTEIDWRLPCLQPLADARDTLLGMIENATDPTKRALLQKDLLVLYGDVAPTLEAHHPYIVAQNPSYDVWDNTPELLYCVEWDNPAHIKLFIKHYATLDPTDQATIFFNELCRLAPLSAPQRGALPLLLANVPYSAIPQYSCEPNVSHALNRIANHLSRTAAAYHHARSTPHQWQPCTACGANSPTTLLSTTKKHLGKCAQCKAQ